MLFPNKTDCVQKDKKIKYKSLIFSLKVLNSTPGTQRGLKKNQSSPRKNKEPLSSLLIPLVNLTIYNVSGESYQDQEIKYYPMGIQGLIYVHLEDLKRMFHPSSGSM